MRRCVLLAAALCSLAMLDGCGWLSGRQAAPPAIEPTVGPGITPSEEPLPPPTEEPSSPPTAKPSGTAATRRVVPPPPATEAAQPDTLMLPPPSISVRLTEEERARLAQEAERDLTLARTGLDRLKPEDLNASQRERAETLRGLIESALASRDRGDVPAASQLARKARLLADELTTR